MGKWYGLIFLCLSSIVVPNALALEFQSVKETGTILYDAPFNSASKRFVVSRYYPVEVLYKQGAWSKVRDATGAITWVHTDALSKDRWLLVVVDQAVLHQQPNNQSPVAFRLAKDSVVTLQQAPLSGWVKVKHPDGSVGYGMLTDFWGL